jgi:hypothetical protein
MRKRLEPDDFKDKTHKSNDPRLSKDHKQERRFESDERKRDSRSMSRGRD